MYYIQNIMDICYLFFNWYIKANYTDNFNINEYTVASNIILEDRINIYDT